MRTTANGIYLISLSKNPDSIDEAMDRPEISETALMSWLEASPGLSVDKEPASLEKIIDRLEKCWLADEVVLYIGKATSLKSRLAQLYDMSLGDRRPNAGGYLLKTLANLNHLHLHYAVTARPDLVEAVMLKTFIENVSPESREKLADPTMPVPFANLELNQKQKKKHGFSAARIPARVAVASEDDDEDDDE
ncbi:MAG: hypothetical protein WCL39_07640 [Armatimonadota bacterium]